MEASSSFLMTLGAACLLVSWGAADDYLLARRIYLGHGFPIATSR